MWLTLLLAKNTGWPESFILWNLPLARALNYQHAIMRAEGLWTVSPTSSETATFQTAHLAAFFAEADPSEDLL